MDDTVAQITTRPSGQELEAALREARTARFHMWKLANAAAGREFKDLDEAEAWIENSLDQ